MKRLTGIGHRLRNLLKRSTSMFSGREEMDLRSAEVKIGDKVYTIYAPKGDVYLDAVGAQFEPYMTDLFRSVLRPDFYCIDVGANIGITSILFSDCVRQVDSYEPSQTTFKVLERNIRSARRKNVALFNLGLGSSELETKLAFSPDNRSGGFVANQIAPYAGHTVETICIKKLDDLYLPKKNVHVNFIKIDVEGFERNVIEGASNVIRNDQPVVVLELNHWCLNAFQRTSVPDFFDFLRSVFPLLYAINSDYTYANLHDESESFRVMYEHIIHSKFSNLVGAFNESQLGDLKRCFMRIS